MVFRQTPRSAQSASVRILSAKRNKSTRNSRVTRHRAHLPGQNLCLSWRLNLNYRSSHALCPVVWCRLLRKCFPRRQKVWRAQQYDLFTKRSTLLSVTVLRALSHVAWLRKLELRMMRLLQAGTLLQTKHILSSAPRFGAFGLHICGIPQRSAFALDV